MPELPEVETVVRDLRPQLAARRIESLQLTRDPAIRARIVRYPSAAKFARRLRGRVIKNVQRRGKYIVMPLDSVGAPRNGASATDQVIVHLGMTGHLRVWEPEETPVKHTHFRALLDSGLELRYDDPRQFGRLVLGSMDELIAAHAFPKRLGPEPIHGDLTEAEFEQLVKARHRPVKSALLDQSFLAGGGQLLCRRGCFSGGIPPRPWAHPVTVRE